jgi:hypothetical protein
VTLLPRLSTHSRRNNFYMAFREVGRVTRTIQLLWYLSDPQLRRRTTAAANKVESYNNFSAWCRFGNEGRVRDNDPAELEHQVKTCPRRWYNRCHPRSGRDRPLPAARRKAKRRRSRRRGIWLTWPSNCKEPDRPDAQPRCRGGGAVRV